MKRKKEREKERKKERKKERNKEREQWKTDILVQQRNDIPIPLRNPDHVAKENINFDVHTKKGDRKINLKTIPFSLFSSSE